MNNYLEALQLSANYYQLTDKCEILRNNLESDGSGGVISRKYVQSTEICKVSKVRLDENTSGGGIGPFNEYRINLRRNADVKANDEIKIVGDKDKSRYFEVVGVNSVSTNTIFLTVDVKERHD